MTALAATFAQFLDAIGAAACFAVLGMSAELSPLAALGPGGALLAKAGGMALVPLAARRLRRPWLMALVAVAGAIGAGTEVAALWRAAW